MEPAEFTPRKKNTNWDYCVVKNCQSKANKNLNYSFHRFPRPNERHVNKQNIFGNSEKIDRLKAWKIALKMSNVTRRMKVCSLHFNKTDYLLPDVQAKYRILKKNAVPSLNLPGEERKIMNEKRNIARLERRQKRSNERENKNEVNESMNENVEQNNLPPASIRVDVLEERSQESMCMDSATVPKVNIEIRKENVSPINANIDGSGNGNSSSNTSEQLQKDVFETPTTPEPLVKNQEVQVHTDCLVPSVIRNLQNNQQLSTATGLESFQLLDTIVEIVKKVCGNKFERQNMILNTKDRVIMTYVKLKQNISYSFLAVLFNCYSAKHCQRIFEEVIKILSKCLKAAIPWPSREEISKNFPKCFRDFQNVRVILDCTEIFTQQPANLCCQVLTYSHYKGSNTLKVMTGVSPSGNITYVSKIYGGRATDSQIFKQSDLLTLLEPGDGIMVDRGFLIDEVCEKNQWKCIRPPFLKEKKQFNKEESLLTSKIAEARVHVERSNQRIKTFKILGSVLPATLLPLSEEIFIVICATINMSAPILKDDKFMERQ